MITFKKWSWFVLAAFGLALFMNTVFSSVSLAKPSNANVQDDGTINFDGKTYKPVNWACSDNDDAKDIRNWTNDPQCKKHYFANSDNINDYVVVEGNLNDATSAQYLDRQFPSSRVKYRDDISLNDGKTFNQKKQEDTRKKQHDDRQSALDENKSRVCSAVDKNNASACETKLQNAFNECYTELGGAGGVEKDVSNDALNDCVARKSGYDKDAINDALTPPLNTDSSAKCNVQGMGWIVCQVSKFIGLVTDGAFKVLEMLLETPGLDRNSDGGKKLYSIWSSIRNLANVVFVIIFMIVIYSQLTNAGISNYGIKRLLPRLIVAIILTNTSYYVCAVLVDVTNVLGGTLKETISAFAVPVRPNFNGWNQVTSAALIVGAGALIYMNIFALIPIVTSGLIAVFIALLLMLTREAFIIILIILSPLAFVLNTLPNTQKWFERWWGTFTTLLMVYPIIAVVYGGSKVAAGIVSATSPNDGEAQLIFAILALGIQTIPFFIVPLIMKASGGVFERFTGVINNPNRGVFDKIKKRSNEFAEDKTKKRDINAVTGNGRGLYATTAKRRAKKDYAAAQTKKQLSGDALNRYLGQGDVAEDIAKAGALGAAGMSSRLPRENAMHPFSEEKREQAKKEREGELDAMAKAAESISEGLKDANLSVDLTDIDAEEAVLDDQAYTAGELDALAKTGKNKDGSEASDAARAAAMRKIASQHDIERVHDLLRSLKDLEKGPSQMQLRAIADGASRSGLSSSAAHLSPSNIAAIRSGEIFQPVAGASASQNDPVNRLYARAAANDLYNSSSLAQQSSQSLAGLRTAMSEAGVRSEGVSGHVGFTNEQISAIKSSATAARDSSRLNTRMSGAAKREISRF